MSNAGTIVLRLAKRGLQQSTCLRPRGNNIGLRCLHSSLFDTPASSKSSLLAHASPRCPQYSQQRCFSRSTRCNFWPSPAAQILKAYGSGKKPEQGLRFQDGELDSQELTDIFGRRGPPPPIANYLLRILHGRRYDGTLDLPLPEDLELELSKYPRAFEEGLNWLRQAYPIDEDEAILARIEREEHALERDNPSELLQRGQDLRFYRGPQSGHYQAKLSEKEGDVYGVSELERLRAQNEAKFQKEEEELQAQIDERMTKVQEEQTNAVAQRPEQGLESAKEVRPPNSFEKWVLKAQNRAQSKLTLESPEVAQQSAGRRLLPSLLLTSLVAGGCFLYTQYWHRPKQSERFFPDLSLSVATIGALLAVNLAVFFAWRMPPFWSSLNKYFIIVPAYPYAFSMLGSLVSHQKLGHLLANMIPLVIFGLPLHEEVGRATFLAMFLSSGILGSFGSLARHTFSKVFVTTTLGASGCVYGVVSAYLWLHQDDRFSIMFLPKDLAEQLSFDGRSLLIALGALQVFGSLRPVKKIDYFDHLVGMAVGAVSAWWWQSNKEKNGGFPKKFQNWWKVTFSGSK
ncbi:uncharacterized protein PV06_05388 [Exophiala oligosperma]|uniref:Peptidase S54 rhomboid domain-containing protein n=1 Tax=Exophiala oligosperma TaxID=215243 RepID=A0A0D2E8Z8_9EURO|nr:uncharacterized protein PV06_05388 [Exophiala oligosperma]KIW44374.1 hypothetical protein PV06_05388 [Exophiala oligosperma]